MNKEPCTVIIGSGCYIPTEVVKNEDFFRQIFFDRSGKKIEKSSPEIIKKLKEITGIRERRHVSDDLVTSDIASLAAQNAIEDAGIDKETLDYIIVAHNFGDIKKGTHQSDMVPSIASRIKRNLNIENPRTIAFDLPFGCPGWLQALIHAHLFIKAGEARRILVVGAETLSRVFDPYDIDSMIYSDGAGAVVVEKQYHKEKKGLLSFSSRSDTCNGTANYLYMDTSYKQEPQKDKKLYLKMHGHRIYEYALSSVPASIKECIDKTGMTLLDFKYLLIHQANEKMDKAILKRLLHLYHLSSIREDFMPMIIQWLGNNSVATIPTLYDLIVKQKLHGYSLNEGDTIIFASVGAGMNINAASYKV